MEEDTPSSFAFSPDSMLSDGTFVGDMTTESDGFQKGNNDQSRLLKLPVDIFKCVADYLDRDSGYALKRVCKGLSESKVVEGLIYKEPFRADDVGDIRRVDVSRRRYVYPYTDNEYMYQWNYRQDGQERWNAFQESVTHLNRDFVQRLAMSHWASLDDFSWIEKNLLNLKCLDISAIKDFVWTPDETWTWKELIKACPNLFSRIEELEVANWADYNTHSRVEFNYAYHDYRFKTEFRMSRRRDLGSVPNTILPACTKLKTLGISGCSDYSPWNEWQVHRRVCSLVDGIVDNCPPSLKCLKIYSISAFLFLFLIEPTLFARMTQIELGLFTWIEDNRERDLWRNFPIRMIAGTHHRPEEASLHNCYAYENCTRNHMSLGQKAVQGGNASIECLLTALNTLVLDYPHLKVKPIGMGRDVMLHPLHLIAPHVPRPHPTLPPNPAWPVEPPNFIAKPEVASAMRWLAREWNWKPSISWDTLMCDVFPKNIEGPSLRPLPKPELMSRLKDMFVGLKELNVPIRLSIGERRLGVGYSGAGWEKSVFFPDYKCFVGEGEDRTQAMFPSQARFNLTIIAHLVDELTVHYTTDTPGAATWRGSRNSSTRVQQLMEREQKGWTKFWARYALRFVNLKKLTVVIPNKIFEHWGESEHLTKLLEDPSWQMLEIKSGHVVNDNHPCFLDGMYMRASYRKRSRPRFVQRVFFREAGQQLDLPDPGWDVTELADQTTIPDPPYPSLGARPHRFWSEMEAKDDFLLQTPEKVQANGTVLQNGSVLNGETTSEEKPKAKKSRTELAATKPEVKKSKQPKRKAAQVDTGESPTLRRSKRRVNFPK